ncbi:hypothetical protein [Spongorhabdus nitratireducens]
MRLTRLAAQMSSTVGDVPCIKGFRNTLLIAGLLTLAAVQPLQAEIGRIIEYQFDFSTPVGEEDSYKHYSVANPTPVPFLGALISSAVDDHMPPVKGFEGRVIYDGMMLDLDLEVAEDGTYEILIFAQDNEDCSYHKGFIPSVPVIAAEGIIRTRIDLGQHTYPMAGCNWMFRLQLIKVPATPDAYTSSLADMQVLVYDNIPDRVRGAAIIDISVPAEFNQQAPLCKGHYLSKLYVAAHTSRIETGIFPTTQSEDPVRNYRLVLVKGRGLDIHLPLHAIRLPDTEIDGLVTRIGIEPEIQQHLFHGEPTRFWKTLEQDLVPERQLLERDWLQEGDTVIWGSATLSVPFIERWVDESGLITCGLLSIQRGFSTLERPEVSYLKDFKMMASGWDEDVCLCLAKDSKDGFNKMRWREDRKDYEVLNPGGHLTEVFKLRSPKYRTQHEIRVCHLPNSEIKHLMLVDVCEAFTPAKLAAQWPQIQQDYASEGTLIVIISETPQQVRQALARAGCNYHLIMRRQDYFKAFNEARLSELSCRNLVYFNEKTRTLRGYDAFQLLKHNEYQLDFSDAGIH